jgi:hypothetical protein
MMKYVWSEVLIGVFAFLFVASVIFFARFVNDLLLYHRVDQWVLPILGGIMVSWLVSASLFAYIIFVPARESLN